MLDVHSPVRRTLFTAAVALALWLAGSSVQARGQTTSFHIGNSLTWDSQPWGIEALAGQRGHDHSVGFHIACNRNLDDIWTNPLNTCVTPVEGFGRFPEALATSQLDAVTMQPWRGGDATLGEDAARILDFIQLARTNPENAKTAFFIYSGWPSRTALATQWTASVPDSDQTRSTTSREYFMLLLDRVRSATDARIFFVPAGEVFYQFGEKIAAGEISGLTSRNDLYRDDLHASYGLGRFLAGVTTYSTLFAENPHGLTAPNGHYGLDESYTPELYEAIYETVWQAVRQYSGRFPGDYNGNGVVEQGDLDLVLLNWGQQANPLPDGWLFDLPRGMIGQEELDRVLLNWGGPTLPLLVSAVPEPVTLQLLLVLLALSRAGKLLGPFVR